jgi:cephalosporin hydroxylase
VRAVDCTPMGINPYGTVVPDSDTFEEEREVNRKGIGRDQHLRDAALELQVAAERYKFGYQHEWCGVPIIRLPDDIVLLQEIVWHTRPSFIVETGIARGGSLVLSSSLMSLAGLTPRVLGLDISIYPHAQMALDGAPFANHIETWEGDSSSDEAVARTKAFIDATEDLGPGLLILDSDHTHKHVIAELRALAPLLPAGSLLLVADTLVEELPPGHYPNRPWDKGNNPMTAVKEFLRGSLDYQMSERWARRGLMTEFRDGVIEKIA